MRDFNHLNIEINMDTNENQENLEENVQNLEPENTETPAKDEAPAKNEERQKERNTKFPSKTRTGINAITVKNLPLFMPQNLHQRLNLW